MSSLQVPLVCTWEFPEVGTLVPCRVCSRRQVLGAPRELMGRKTCPEVGTECHRCPCGQSSKLHPGGRSKAVSRTVRTLWWSLTVPAALELPRRGRGRLGCGAVSSSHTCHNCVNAKDVPGCCHCISLLWISSLLPLTCWANSVSLREVCMPGV